MVQPLLVLQAPNTPDPDEIGRSAGHDLRGLPELPGDVVAHVFGDTPRRSSAAWVVDWIEPQRVQDAHVRVLVAKDAISTGWDCPRAEVLVSFRPAKDQTHITQLLGRMVRSPSPVASPATSDSTPSTASCRSSTSKPVTAVADTLMTGEDRAVTQPPLDPSCSSSTRLKMNTEPFRGGGGLGEVPVPALTVAACQLWAKPCSSGSPHSPRSWRLDGLLAGTRVRRPTRRDAQGPRRRAGSLRRRGFRSS